MHKAARAGAWLPGMSRHSDEGCSAHLAVNCYDQCGVSPLDQAEDFRSTIWNVAGDPTILNLLADRAPYTL